MSILVLTSDTLIGTPATGNLEYNGQFFGTDSNASRAQLQRITQGTAVASTSGTSIDFTGLPAWVKKITVMLQGVSLSSTANILIQIGPSGGVETSGYSGVVLGNGTQTAWGGTGCLITRTGVATSTYSGIVTLANITGSTWVCSATVADSVNTFTGLAAGSKAITGTLSIVRITSTSTDTFDAGNINLLLEG